MFFSRIFRYTMLEDIFSRFQFASVPFLVVCALIHVTDYARFFQLSTQSFLCPFLCLMQVLIFPSASTSVCRAGLVNAVNNLHERFHQRTFTTKHKCLIPKPKIYASQPGLHGTGLVGKKETGTNRVIQARPKRGG